MQIKKARLDADRNARPLTRLIRRADTSKPVLGPLAGAPATDYEGDDGRRVALAQGWTCAARPAALGRMCGFRNTRGVVYAGLVCCESCGATKAASDDRQARGQ